jgi:hypothetical protein
MVLGEIQKQMKELHEQQAQYDIITLENTIDEYIRIIGSIRVSLCFFEEGARHDTKLRLSKIETIDRF